jgi:ion channel-forming bestrophin family protein
MYVKRNYGFWMTFYWSIKPFVIGLIYSLCVASIIYFAEVRLFIPWQPIGVIGIAVAFYLGFKNNSSYDRTWEARKIWGGIVNDSRTFGAMSTSFIQGENATIIQKELIHRHIAWLTALRHQLRLSRTWEHTEQRLNGLYAPTVCEAYTNKLDEELGFCLSKEELKSIEGKSNAATQILNIQSKRLQELRDLGYFEDFRHMEFHHIIANLYAGQGKSERIKNFPFPRQYASTALWLCVVFCAFVPIGLMDVFKSSTTLGFWMAPFISALIIWIFFLMEKIGDYSENPFEGTYNDVPITSIARGIEIDLKEMINEENIPKPILAKDGFLM